MGKHVQFPPVNGGDFHLENFLKAHSKHSHLDKPIVIKPVSVSNSLKLCQHYAGGEKIPGMLGSFRLNLMGTLVLKDASGKDFTPKNQKNCALIAMLATAPDGRRGRRWLQDKLWSESDEGKGSANLRQAVYSIRQTLGEHKDLIYSDNLVVRLDTSKVVIDIYKLMQDTNTGINIPDFLEGFDIRDPEFEDWLREQREHWREKIGGAGSFAEPDVEENDRYRGLARSTKTVEGNRVSDPVGAVFERADEHSETSKRLAVAILPLVNRSGILDLNFFSDGFSEELIERLARLVWLPVVARSSCFAFRNPDRDLEKISSKLRARYVVDGEVSLSDKGIAVRINLNNMDEGSTFWSTSFELPRSLDEQATKEALKEAVAQIDSRIDLAEQKRSVTSQNLMVNYDEQVWRGRWHLNKLTRVDASIAREYLDLAMREKPQDAEALVQNGIWHILRVWTNRGNSDEIKIVRKELFKAQAADANDGRSLTLLGIAELWLRNHGEAIAFFERAISRNPSLAKAHEQLGTCHYLTGKPNIAVKHLEHALRLSPHDQHEFFMLGELAIAYHMLGEHEMAVELASHSLMYRPRYWYAHLIKLSALQASGDTAGYENALSKFFEAGVVLRPHDFDWIPFQDNRWIEELKAHVKL